MSKWSQQRINKMLASRKKNIAERRKHETEFIENGHAEQVAGAIVAREFEGFGDRMPPKRAYYMTEMERLHIKLAIEILKKITS